MDVVEELVECCDCDCESVVMRKGITTQRGEGNIIYFKLHTLACWKSKALRPLHNVAMSEVQYIESTL